MKIEVVRLKKSEVEDFVADKKSMGYIQTVNYAGEIVLIQRRVGKLINHVLIFLLTFWSFGLFNFLYLVYAFFIAPNRIIIRNK